jgi:hypothetical protein
VQKLHVMPEACAEVTAPHGSGFGGRWLELRRSPSRTGKRGPAPTPKAAKRLRALGRTEVPRKGPLPYNVPFEEGKGTSR